MIKIKIAEPTKLSSVLIKKSCYISFDYNSEILSYIKSFSNRFYDIYSKTWEVPINNLAKFCNKFDDERIEITGVYEDISTTYNSEIPKDYEFKTKPYKHQIDGVKFGLYTKKFLLCDDQGLGKSKQVIDLVGCLSKTDKINKVLIICGINSLKYNWQEEVKIHSDESAWVLGTRFRKNGNRYEGNTDDKLADLFNLPDCKYIVTNIETMRAGAKKISKTKYTFPIAEKLKELCNNGTISVIAFDEIHKNKNSAALQSKATLLLRSKYMIAMSGTPIMNSPLDLYFPLRWLGYEQHSLYQFKQHYCTFSGSEVVGFKNLDELKDSIQDFMLRRLKTEVLDLPEKIRTVEYVEMGTKQSKVYKDVYNNTVKNMHKMRFSNNPLSMLTHLRQATAHTSIIYDSISESAKIDRMVELVEDITDSNKKVIIFSNWERVTSIAKEKLKKYNPACITGKVSTNERMTEVNRFQNDDKCKVIIGTIGAMGTGLTLTSAQTVIFLDSPWNRALKDQAEDRAHRIGTKGTVNIITLVTKNTIDEKIEDIVYKKGMVSDALIDGKGGKNAMKMIEELLS